MSSAPVPTASTLAARTPPSRDRTVDCLRVASLAVVLVGHTLMATVEPSGRVGNVLATLPQAQLLTWLFQVVPVFFLVGGFSHAAALRSRPPYGAFVASRMTRLVPPAAVLCGVWLATGVVLELTGHAGSAGRGTLARSAARLAVQPLWFLGVYVAVVALAPAMLALHRRFGLRVLLVLAALTGVLDVLRFSAGGGSDGSVPGLCYLSVGTVWLAVHSLGFAWYDGTLERLGRPLAVGGLAVAATLVRGGPYPTSMVGLPGAPVSNM